jgi:hypothetical protein
MNNWQIIAKKKSKRGKTEILNYNIEPNIFGSIIGEFMVQNLATINSYNVPNLFHPEYEDEREEREIWEGNFKKYILDERPFNYNSILFKGIKQIEVLAKSIP